MNTVPECILSHPTEWREHRRCRLAIRFEFPEEEEAEKMDDMSVSQAGSYLRNNDGKEAEEEAEKKQAEEEKKRKEQ